MEEIILPDFNQTVRLNDEKPNKNISTYFAVSMLFFGLFLIGFTYHKSIIKKQKKQKDEYINIKH